MEKLKILNKFAYEKSIVLIKLVNSEDVDYAFHVRHEALELEVEAVRSVDSFSKLGAVLVDGNCGLYCKKTLAYLVVVS